jgi:hypothetical protein
MWVNSSVLVPTAGIDTLPARLTSWKAPRVHMHPRGRQESFRARAIMLTVATAVVA